MAYTFFGFWLWIIIDVIMVFGVGGYTVWYHYFDTRLRLFNFYPHKQLTFHRSKINNDTVTIISNNKEKQYTINRDYIYYKGRIPYAFYWDNIPIPLNLNEQNVKDKLTSKERTKLKELLKKIDVVVPININMPTTKLKATINIDTAETFFRILHTNLTLNLLKPPKEFKQAIKYTMILLVVGGIVVFIMHSLGYIDVMELLGSAKNG